jgi:hypothetical protein
MKRSAFAANVVLALTATASIAFAQAKPAAPAQSAAAPAVQPAPARAKWVAPVKGIASIEIIRGMSKKVGNEMVTTLKIKNTSNGAIALLRVDEYWFDKSTPPKTVSGDTQRHRNPLLPGEVVEITTRSPVKPNLYMNTFAFTHANGKVDAKVVKQFK